MRAITYREMDEKIVGLLEFQEGPLGNYAAARIRQLEAETERLQTELALTRSQAMRTKEALVHCGIGGIYDTFDGPADAIGQMADYIKELGRRLERAQARETELVHAGRTLSSLARLCEEEPEFVLDQQDLAEFDGIVEWEAESW